MVGGGGGGERKKRERHKEAQTGGELSLRERAVVLVQVSTKSLIS